MALEHRPSDSAASTPPRRSLAARCGPLSLLLACLVVPCHLLVRLRIARWRLTCCRSMNRRPTVPLGTIAREWLRIGLIGFGGPPAHITLLRELVRQQEAAGWTPAPSRTRTRPARCSRARPRPSSRSSAPIGVGGPAGRGGRRPRLRRARRWSWSWRSRCSSCRPRRRAGCAAPGRARAPRSRRSRCAPAASWSGPATGTRWMGTATGCAGSPTWLAGVAAAAILIGPYLVLVLVACGLLELVGAAARFPARCGAGSGARAARGRGLVRRDRRARLDGAQGRRPLVRRRLRDHPADAGRRRQRLPLDDRRASS